MAGSCFCKPQPPASLERDAKKKSASAAASCGPLHVATTKSNKGAREIAAEFPTQAHVTCCVLMKHYVEGMPVLVWTVGPQQSCLHSLARQGSGSNCLLKSAWHADPDAGSLNP